MKKLWDIIIGSFSGGERDYTSMGVRRAILLLSIPMVLEMGMEATFAIVDAFFVAKLGTASVATVGLTESLLVAVYSIA